MLCCHGNQAGKSRDPLDPSIPALTWCRDELLQLRGGLGGELGWPQSFGEGAHGRAGLMKEER